MTAINTQLHQCVSVKEWEGAAADVVSLKSLDVVCISGAGSCEPCAHILE